MKNYLFLCFCAVVLLCSCDEDAGVSQPKFNSNIDTSAKAVATIYDLGLCTRTREGDSVWVEKDSSYYLCKNKEWHELETEEESSSSVKSSSSKAKPSSSEKEEGESSSSSKSSSSVARSSSSDATSSCNESSSAARSSSSVVSRSSSSSKTSSSSRSGKSSGSGYPVFDPESVEYGELLDSRDGHVYKTVKIGTQNWLAQNLNFANDTVFSGCIVDSLGGCDKYGRAYIWHSAMELKEVSKNCGAHPSTLTEYIDSPHRGVCPEGWHIPTETEWDVLVDFVELHNGDELAGTSLKADNWQVVDGLPQGTNRFGFSAIEAGSLYVDKNSFNFSFAIDPEKPTRNFFKPRAGYVYDPVSGARVDQVSGGAIFCSTVGNAQLVYDEFLYKVQDDVLHGCSVRCIED